MRFGLNKEQWDRLIEHSDSISSFPATVGNFLQRFTEEEKNGCFYLSYDSCSRTYCVGFNDLMESFKDKELINALFDMFCYLEKI